MVGAHIAVSSGGRSLLVGLEVRSSLFGLRPRGGVAIFEGLCWAGGRKSADLAASEQLQEHKQKVLTDLRAARELKITPRELSVRIFQLPAYLQSLLSNLDHFISDEDIRDRDAKYKDMQTSQLDKLIALIENDASPKEIRKINFLRSE
jgi:hypothetical protein